MTSPLLHRATGPAQGLLRRLSPRQKQYATLLLIVAVGVGVLTLVFTLSDDEKQRAAGSKPAARPATRVTSVEVMSPGQQVNPLDQWVGTAGNKLAQYESERDEQSRMNKDRLDFETRILRRFSDLEQRLTAAGNATPSAAAQGDLAGPLRMPPAASLPLPPPPAPPTSLPAIPPPPYRMGSPTSLAMPAGTPPMPPSYSSPLSEPRPLMTRVQVSERKARPNLEEAAAGGSGTLGPSGTSASGEPESREHRDVTSFLPVSFTRGVLLGGLDAPTGGQSQGNPHPVLIRLTDNSVLPSRFRAAYRECFVVAAGYGDISSERAYLRTESLSCVRPDGAALEVQIKGSIFGEDGKVGMRGRLVTKQGQMLANALLAGVVSGIGQGVASANTTVSSSPLGSIASTNGTDAYRTGLGTGVGRALDRLAQYYIKLAENTFPVIEIDGGREIDVVITRGTRIDPPLTARVLAEERRNVRPVVRYMEVSDADND